MSRVTSDGGARVTIMGVPPKNARAKDIGIPTHVQPPNESDKRLKRKKKKKKKILERNKERKKERKKE